MAGRAAGRRARARGGFAAGARRGAAPGRARRAERVTESARAHRHLLFSSEVQQIYAFDLITISGGTVLFLVVPVTLIVFCVCFNFECT